ncbi:GABA permease [Aspergillus terreus]|uniref:GABA permease n=1 Tax=Aspergillus terreus TaxID=33178 RepID=A0A5M3YYZ5_ASPTE|nr:hypothetical protein ATETN484_0006037800 [Aspergillus terreus]GFF12032.1 GABA permease [Aspergillus terreus]
MIHCLGRCSGAGSESETGIVRALLEHGVDPNGLCDGVPRTPLQRAMELGDVEIATLLLEYEAIPHVKILPWGTKGRKKPPLLHIARQLDEGRFIRLLLDNGVDPCYRWKRRSYTVLVEEEHIGQVERIFTELGFDADEAKATKSEYTMLVQTGSSLTVNSVIRTRPFGICNFGTPCQWHRRPTTCNIILREHQPHDLDWIVARHGALYEKEYGFGPRFEALVAQITADFQKNYDHACERCWIAEEPVPPQTVETDQTDTDPNASSLGSIMLVRDPDASKTAKLRLLLVEPRARGRGVGRSLIQQCVRFARETGYERVVLWTQSVLESARRLYRAEGFQLLKQEEHEGFGVKITGEFWELMFRFAPRKPWSTGIAETFSFGKWLMSIYLIVDKLSLLQRLLHGDVVADEEADNQHALSHSVGEDARLEDLGYEQELKRTFGLLGMIGFSFSVVTSWTALSGVFIVGVTSGGPPVMVFSFIGVSLLTLAVAIPMAEMCSMYPVAGGQYSWVAALAPPSIARGFSYVSGWFMIIGVLAMGATNNSIGANFVLGMANLVFPEYTIQRWQTVLVAYLIALMSTAINIWGAHLLNRLARFILIWNVGSFLVTMIVVLATNDHKQPASFVFSEFQNFSGWGSAMAAIVGILQACFGMCCYDAPSHMTEEMKSASKEAPKAIILSVVLGAVTGFAFLLTLCFCIGDIDTTANTATGVPVIQIFYDSTGSKAGTCVLASMITVIVIVAGNNLLAEGSRSVYAFARDHGLPFSGVLSKVQTKHRIPLNAILLTLVVQLALDAIDFGTTTGFKTVIAISTEGFYVSYALALIARLLGFVTGHNPVMKGPFALPQPLSIALNILGLLFLLFAAITFNFPQTYPVTQESMNYTSAAIGVIAVISFVTWITTGRKHFTGPAAMQVLHGRNKVSEPSGEVSEKS